MEGVLQAGEQRCQGREVGMNVVYSFKKEKSVQGGWRLAWRDCGEMGRLEGGRDPRTGRGHSAVGRRAPHTHAASKGTERTVRAGTGPVQERVGHVQWVRGVEGIGR